MKTDDDDHRDWDISHHHDDDNSDDDDLGGFAKAYIHGKYKSADFEWFSQLAVAAYNRRFKEENRELEFVKVLKAVGMPCSGEVYYVTFTARDVADGYKLKIYETVVYENLKYEVSVLSFRLKTSEDDDGDNVADAFLRKEWFWKSHFGPVSEEIMDILPRIPPPSEKPYDDGDWDMLKEKHRTLRGQVLKSDGFDVDSVPGGSIRPMNLTVKTENVDYESFSKLVVNEYNHRFKEESKELEFVKVLKVMAEPACEFRFYITFMAKDLADGGEVKTYQAVLSMGLQCKMSVLSFRIKPTEEEQDDSGNYGKAWFWEGHRNKRKHDQSCEFTKIDQVYT